jgi:hypothetical protein
MAPTHRAAPDGLYGSNTEGCGRRASALADTRPARRPTSGGPAPRQGTMALALRCMVETERWRDQSAQQHLPAAKERRHTRLWPSSSAPSVTGRGSFAIPNCPPPLLRRTTSVPPAWGLARRYPPRTVVGCHWNSSAARNAVAGGGCPGSAMIGVPCAKGWARSRYRGSARLILPATSLLFSYHGKRPGGGSCGGIGRSRSSACRTAASRSSVWNGLATIGAPRAAVNSSSRGGIGASA